MKKYVIIGLFLISTITILWYYFIYNQAEKNLKNENLIRFEIFYVGKNVKYEEFRSHLKKPVEINVQYVEEYIIATTYTMGNECLFTTADIEYKNDSIILTSKEISEKETCNGLEIKKFIYIIKNEEKKKYKFGYKGVNYHYYNTGW